MKKKQHPRHTFNNLRRELGGMTMEQKQEVLQELQQELFLQRGQEIPERCFILRKCIALVKTSMNVKGFHFHPRRDL